MQSTNTEIDKLKLNLQATIDTLKKYFVDLRKEIFFAFVVPAVVSAILGFLISASFPTSPYPVGSKFVGTMFFSVLIQFGLILFSTYWIFRFTEKLYALITIGSYDGYNYEKSKNRLTNYFLVCTALGFLCILGVGVAGLPILAVLVFLPLCPFVTIIQNASVLDSLKIGFELTEGNRVHLLLVNIMYLIALGSLSVAFRSVGSALVSVFMLGYVTGLLNLYIKASSILKSKVPNSAT